MHRRPGKMTTTSTQGSADMVELLGGHTLEGVSFTTDEMRNLYGFYGFDPNSAEEITRQHHQEVTKEVEARNARVTEEHAKLRYSWESPKLERLPTETDRQQAKAFVLSRESLNLLREARTDGLRLMAYLSHFLQEGEDPVAFVHGLCRDAGFDTGSTGFVEEEEPTDE